MEKEREREDKKSNLFERIFFMIKTPMQVEQIIFSLAISAGTVRSTIAEIGMKKQIVNLCCFDSFACTCIRSTHYTVVLYGVVTVAGVAQ